MKITYIIRQEDDPAITYVKGYRFVAGAATEVSDPAVIATLALNPWFLVEGATPIKGDLSEVNRDPTPILVGKRGPGRPRKVA